ncbi:MAG: hypothetical protein Kow00117_03370 [Phototrophicales bacterium]|nr:MAG: hypothetical protein D6711_00530 [Chloroflexota bacterium]
MMDDNIPTETIAETENFMTWISEEPDGETVFHVELSTITLHFFREDWEEFLQLMKETLKSVK